MSLRKSDVFLCSIVIAVCLLSIIFVHASLRRNSEIPALGEKAKIVKALELTDICLFTEARYTRNPAMADLHTPFQDHPMSFEHFPSGSLMVLPHHLRNYALDR